MKTNKKRVLSSFAFAMLTLLFTTLLSTNIYSQTSFKVGGKPLMTLYGTSTLHDFEMNARSFTSNAQFTVSADNQLQSVNAINVVLPVQNLKGEKDGLNENAYEALNSEKYPNIVFKMTSGKVTPSGGNKYQLTAQGNLTLAGVTKSVTLSATAVVNADGSISTSGSVPLKLSDFNIDRPSFMLGTMKVGDAFTLNYSLVYVK
jgi:polyisoprenoid-binding protein YceI